MAEAGIAGGSAVLGQKLLEAVFGDQAVRSLAERARRDLEVKVNDLLEGERGADACSILVSRIRREGPARAIELAFDASARNVEAEWRRYLREDLPRAGSMELDDDFAPFENERPKY